MKPRTADDLAAYFADEGPRYPCSRHGFREAVAPIALRRCAECKEDAQARYADGAPLCGPSDERWTENQTWLWRGRAGSWRNS